jgi:hypothetical protein
MRKILVLTFAALPFFAQSQLEAYGRYVPRSSIEPIINYYGEKKITEKFYITFFGLVRQNWSQALIGMKYAPSQSFNMAFSAGIEDGTSSPRYGASIWKKRGKTSVLVLGELGAGDRNYLYKANLFQHYSEKFTVGLTAWRFHGVGPNFRVSSKQLATTLWAMPAYDFEFKTARFMIGVSTQM